MMKLVVFRRPNRTCQWVLAVAITLAGGWASPCFGKSTLVAAAANFAGALAALETVFEASHPFQVETTLGSTGKLLAQVLKGAPYDIFLSADQTRVDHLETEGLVQSGSRFTYALGRISLWSANGNLLSGNARHVIAHTPYRALAIANPKLAPYGEAAQETLKALGLWKNLKTRIVMGQNIGQTYSLIASGNAELGFVATSLLSARPTGSRWDVPAFLHRPIRQDAVLLKRAKGNPAADAFYAFLRSAVGQGEIARQGYDSD